MEGIGQSGCLPALKRSHLPSMDSLLRADLTRLIPPTRRFRSRCMQTIRIVCRFASMVRPAMWSIYDRYAALISCGRSGLSASITRSRTAGGSTQYRCGRTTVGRWTRRPVRSALSFSSARRRISDLSGQDAHSGTKHCRRATSGWCASATRKRQTTCSTAIRRRHTMRKARMGRSAGSKSAGPRGSQCEGGAQGR